MRVSQAFPIALLLAVFAAGPASIARGSAFHDDREPRIHDDHTSRDATRDQRDTDRREQDARDRELKDAKDLAERQAKDAADAVKDSSDTQNASSSGSSGSGDGSSGSGSGSSGSGSGSSGSGSGSSGSGSGSSGSGSGSSGSGSGSSGSGSGSSGSGSGDDDDADDDDDSGGDVSAASDSGRIAVETDPEGRERRKGELLVHGDDTLAEALHGAGFVRLSVRHLANLDQSVIRVRVRDGSTFDADLAFLRTFQGAVDAEPNYVFRLSGGAATAPTAAAPMPNAVADSGIHVGVIDTGADSAAPGLGERIGSSRAFGGRYTPRAHGTHVAQILVRQGVRVDVADVFQTDANGAPLATAESIARGIDWMASRGVPVINVSITGPRSALLSEVVARAIARGSIIVAAAGNDGPAAPAVYPAAFPEVVGVTAVDADGRIYRRANRGDYVDFAAFGVRVPVDAGGGRLEYVSGTSYAAPLVAATVARHYRAPRPGDAPTEVGVLRGRAVDIGDRGRDPVFGWGLVPPPAR
jgi:minor extracellular protease Epr